jgi:hypothetical protein
MAAKHVTPGLINSDFGVRKIKSPAVQSLQDFFIQGNTAGKPPFYTCSIIAYIYAKFQVHMSFNALPLAITALFAVKPLPALVFTPAEKIITYKLGSKDINIKVVQYGNNSNTCCINLHDDECTAVKAAQAVLEQKGGLLIRIENNAQRLISFPYRGVTYTFDPNRIFSRKGIELTLKSKGRITAEIVTEVEKFAKKILQLIPDSASCVIALHNNSDGDYSVKTYQPGGNRQTDAKKVYADSWQDVDDITLTTDEDLFTRMSGFGFNSILQDNVKVIKDGSLSVYYGEKNKRYINIETQHGKNDQYKEMLSKLLYVLDEENKKPKEDKAVTADVDY